MIGQSWKRLKARLAAEPGLKAHRAQLHREHRIRLRAEVIAAYGGKCVCCGETELVFLCIDHVHGGGNAERRRVKAPLYYGIKREGYPDRYQVLCHNCNWAKSHGGCPHMMNHARHKRLL